MSAQIARPYAVAAFSYADEHQCLDAWADMFKSLAAGAEVIEEAARTHPGSDAVIAQSLTEALAIKDPGQVNFLLILAQNRRLTVIKTIAELFDGLYLSARGIVAMRVESAYPMTAAAQKQFNQFLSEWSGKQARVVYEENRELLGGVRIYVDDNVWDASVRSRLDQMARALN